MANEFLKNHIDNIVRNDMPATLNGLTTYEYAEQATAVIIDRIEKSEVSDTVDEVMQLSTFNQVNAYAWGNISLKEILKFPLEAYEYCQASPSLELTMKDAMKFNNEFQVKALQMVGSVKDALKFSNEFQVEAYSISHMAGNSLQFTVDEALQFTNEFQVKALQMIGSVKDALKFSNEFQVEAYSISYMDSYTTGNSLQFTVDEALQFTNEFQVKAHYAVSNDYDRIKLCSVEEALKFTNEFQIEALNAVSNDYDRIKLCSAEEALLFETGIQVEALKAGMPVKMALLVDSPVTLFKEVGDGEYDMSLAKLAELNPVQAKAFKIDNILYHQAKEFTNEAQVHAAEISANHENFISLEEALMFSDLQQTVNLNQYVKDAEEITTHDKCQLVAFLKENTLDLSDPDFVCA